MEASNRVNEFLERVRSRFEKLRESVGAANVEDDLVHTIIQRIDVDGEAPVGAEWPATTEDREEMYRRLLKRLEWQVKKSGIGVEEAVRAFPGEVRAVLLYKSYERFKSGDSNLLRERLIEMGWKNIQPNLWILPPNKTPTALAGQEDLKIWLRRELARPLGKEFDYSFPIVALVDIRKVTADKKGIRKMPVARTIFNVLEANEVVPARHIYETMKARGMGVREIITSGDITFLTSAFASPEELAAIQENETEIGAKLRSATGSQLMGLVDIANLAPEIIADALGSNVAHPSDMAQRLIVEAQFWMRYLGGTVPERS